MPKPQGTYLRIQQNERSRHDANQARQTVATSRSRDLDEFFRALDRASERDLDRWYRSISALVDKLKSGKPQSKEDKDRETISEAIGEIRKVFEKVQDIRQLEGRLSVPLQPVLRAPEQPVGGGLEIALVIAVCQVFEVLVRLRRRK